ncbi:hypothetical protein DSC45_16185 [Streptomyces sp. YIM 130001]|uniref:hypothetical protein n=1 Tax=Streptomyces sp. YIM 130001 TaxID=2259644 RepID=UPI000E65C134|nr:hypothetical protein [Streptomyces sp. YIM 130001]RII16126.1 hypothetical protein DSC45_16185 [Streptomyces sp. YIM 130001]
MISITKSTIKMTDVDRSVVATCILGNSYQGTGLSGIRAVLPASPSFAALEVREGNERPTKAPEAVAAAQAQAYAFAAAGAGFRTKHHMWAYRGLEPWSDPA